MATQKKEDYTDEEVLIAKYAKALGHPARIAILNYLASIDGCFFGDICNELPIANSTVSQHLTELKNAELIQGTFEPPKVKYCIHPQNWEQAKVLLEKFFAKISPKMQCCD
ncbi:MAG: winged helix-turn-helix domain-containing protein [Bacteroidota bacterium]